MSALWLDNIGHAFLGRTVLEGVSLAIAPGELVALVGPSGSGKSTLAHIAAGLVDARKGRIIRNYRRHAVVFQEPRLMPWATAAENIAFSLSTLGLSRRESRERVVEAARSVALDAADLEKYPSQLSGGMRQRAAIARALAVQPDFLFFDEPFTALDVALKRRMQDIVIASLADGRRGGLFITHDIAEAVRIAHRIVVLDPRGRGIAGSRTVPLVPGGRDDRMVFETAQDFLLNDPACADVNSSDERRAG